MIFILILIPFTYAHLILNEPFVWGIDDGGSLEQPLEITTDNWVCAGKQPENNGIVTLEAGKTYKYSTTCGEKDVNADGCLIGDWHSTDNVDDFAGCVLGVSYGNYKNVENWKYISYQRNCAKRGALNSFTIAKNVESIKNGVCSWAWIPSINYASPQMYMNCFYCNIIGNGDKNTMKDMEFANVPGGKYTEKVYNDFVNPNDIYPSVTKTKTRTLKTYTKTKTIRKSKKTRYPKIHTKCI